MKRLNMFELMDQSWWPVRFKRMETEYLSAANRILGLYRPAISKLGHAMRQIGCRNIVDLCSGSGTHMEPVLNQIENEQNAACRITLTDIAPHPSTYQNLTKNNAGFDHVSTPVDARDVPENLQGFRTLFAGFHHFSPDQAKNILKNAFNKGTGIAIFEHTRRSPLDILSMLFTPVIVMALTPFIRPFDLSRFFWTYIVPVIPLAILWDGLVSAFRSYTETELHDMTASLQSPDYQWDFETFRVGGVVNTTLLIGYPLGYAIKPCEVRAKDYDRIPKMADSPELAPQM